MVKTIRSMPSLRRAMLTAWACLLAVAAAAQGPDGAGNAYNLPSLDSLITLALQHSPVLKLSDAQIQQQYFTVKSQKRQWSQRVAGNLNGGLGNRIITQMENGTVGLVSTPVPFYMASVSVSIPLSQVIDQKNRVGISESAYKAAKVEKDIRAQEITDQVTQLYYQLVTNINVLKIRRDALQSLQIQKALAEKDLKIGNIGIAEMSELIRSVAEEESDYETFKQGFLMNWKQLENITGQPLKINP